MAGMRHIIQCNTIPHDHQLYSAGSFQVIQTVQAPEDTTWTNGWFVNDATVLVATEVTVNHICDVLQLMSFIEWICTAV